MKKLLFRFIILLSGIFTLTSCGPLLNVQYFGEKPAKITKVALVSTMIDKIEQNPIPLIDAAVFHAKTNKIAEDINMHQQKIVNKYREVVASGISENLHCDVIYGEKLHEMKSYQNFVSQYKRPNDLITGNANFPMIFIASGDVNIFPFNKMSVLNYFKEPVNYSEIIAGLCKELDVDMIAISYSRLYSGAGYYGIMGYLNLGTSLLLFDASGKLLIQGSNISSPAANITGKDVLEYVQVLDNIKVLFDPVIQKIGGTPVPVNN